MKLIVGIAGASGSIYAASFLRAIMSMEGETYLIVSPAALRIFREEYSTNISSGKEILEFISDRWHITHNKNHILERDFKDIGSDIASGSNKWDGMVVIPT